ncbi:MAG: inorganic phosphate transporter [Candidatus Xenobia bacterium]
MVANVLFGFIAVGCMFFAVINGMNDLSGVVASLIATRATRLGMAQLLALGGVWLGIIMGSDAVARTVAVGLVTLQPAHLGTITCLVVWLGAVAGSVVWVYTARLLGLPTSATHTFVGALCGATIAGTLQPGLCQWGVRELLHSHQVTGVLKVFAGLLLSPVIGFILGFAIYRLLALTLSRAGSQVNARLRRMELLTVFTQSFTYCLNDAHTVMGVLTGASISAGMVLEPGHGFVIPLPVKLLVAFGLTLGARVGSLNILRVMGRGLFHMRPAEAFAGQLAAAASVLGASTVGAPVSSTQVTSSALIGVGGAWRPRHVRWQKVREILMSWFVTFPAAALVAATFTVLLRLLQI